MHETPLPITGGCLCGAVRFSIAAQPIAQRMCWCRICQYSAAGNATVSVLFPSDALTLAGEIRDYAITADSGNRMHRSFCPTCGTPLFNRGSRRPEVLVVRVGALDHPERFPPGTQIWASRRPAWVEGLLHIPAVAGQP